MSSSYRGDTYTKSCLYEKRPLWQNTFRQKSTDEHYLEPRCLHLSAPQPQHSCSGISKASIPTANPALAENEKARKTQSESLSCRLARISSMPSLTTADAACALGFICCFTVERSLRSFSLSAFCTH